MRLRVLIADDEPLARERLRQLLQAESAIEIIGESATGFETLKLIQDQSPDLVLMDVRMPGLDGFEVIRALNRQPMPIFIFVTAHDQFALRAFEIHPADFLLKPVDRVRFHRAIGRAREMAQQRELNPSSKELAELATQWKTSPKPVERLAIRSSGRITLVALCDVDWVQSADNYCELHVGNVAHLLRRTLVALSRQLAASGFQRISRSALVNVDRVKEVRARSHGDYLVILRNGVELPASRNYRGTLKRLLGKES